MLFRSGMGDLEIVVVVVAAPQTLMQFVVGDGVEGGSSWIIDSGCTNHMTGEKKMFTSYVKNKDSQDSIIFGDGNQGKVKGLACQAGKQVGRAHHSKNVMTTSRPLELLHMDLFGSYLLWN